MKMSSIYVLGDTQNCSLYKHDMNNIMRGVVAAAKTTGSTIVCSTDDGISEFLKDATEDQDFNIVVEIPEAPNDQQGRVEGVLLDRKDISATCVVFGGKLELVQSILDVAEVVENIRFIIVDGSGKAADFITHGCNLKSLSSDHLNELINNNKETGYGLHFDDIESTVLNGYLQKCTSFSQKFILWSPGGGIGLNAIIENVAFAFLEAKKVGIGYLLETTLKWNRLDLAEKKIFPMSNFLDMNDADKKKRIIDGLVQNKVGFVRKLLKSCPNFECSLTFKELYNIYMESVAFDHKNQAVILFTKLFFSLEIVWGKDEGRFFNRLGRFIETLLTDTHLNPYKDEKGNCSPKDLFCWALLLNRYELSVLFWTRGENYISAALFASALLKKLSKQAEGFGGYFEESQRMKNNSTIFEQFASVIINNMYLRRCELAKMLLVYVDEHYGNTTPLYIAGNNNLMDFMEQTACQAKLTEIWNGNMALSTSLVKKIGCILLPVLLLLTVNFKSPKKIKLIQTTNHEHYRIPRYYMISSFKRENRISLIEAIHSFYTAPVIKFISAVISYLVFLVMFSLMIMTDLHPLENGGVSSLESIVIFWALTLILEDVREVIDEDQPSTWSKIRLWFSSLENRFAFVGNIVFLVAITTRSVLPIDLFRWARYFYSITVVIYWLISMRFLFVHKNIGPKVVMIGKMLTDLVFVIVIFLVVIISVGIAYNANIYPNSMFNWATVKKLLFYPYWQIHGELFLDYIRGREPDPPGECSDDPYRNGTLPACPVKFDMITMIAVVYLILLNVILVNVLIAMFSYTFLKVQSNAGKVARFHNYSLVYKYNSMPSLVAPFIVIIHMYRLARRCCWKRRHNEFKIRLTSQDNIKVSFYETEAMETSVLPLLFRYDTDQLLGNLKKRR